MELMFAPGFTVGTQPKKFTDEELLKLPMTRPYHCLSQRGMVKDARQIAAENAAWWSKETQKYKFSAMHKFNLKWAFVCRQCVNWNTVYRQGQLYQHDTVVAFDPKYGELA